MIVLENQLALQFNIGDKSDFLGIKDFHCMRIAENAGGLRPILNLTFQVSDESIIPFLNSGNIIYLMYGINEPTSDILQFEICGDDKTRGYKVGSAVSIIGAMYNRGFTSNKKTFIYSNRRSFEALSTISTQNGLKFVSNVNKTNDKQSWYQNGITDWEMATHIANRAYKDNNTFYTWGFDNNNFYFYDIREQLRAKTIKWYLTVNNTGKETKDNSIVNIGTYKTSDKYAGQNAELAGKNVTTVNYNLDTGEFTNPTYNLKTFTTMNTKKINVNSEGCVNYDYRITNGDEHSFSVEAQNQNFRNNVLFSSYTCHVPVAGQYRDFRLLDLVQLIPSDEDREAEGLYFITGIAKEYKNQKYSTLLTLNRESPNDIQGNLEGGA